MKSIYVSYSILECERFILDAVQTTHQMSRPERFLYPSIYSNISSANRNEITIKFYATPLPSKIPVDLECTIFLSAYESGTKFQWSIHHAPLVKWRYGIALLVSSWIISSITYSLLPITGILFVLMLFLFIGYYPITIVIFFHYHYEASSFLQIIFRKMGVRENYL